MKLLCLACPKNACFLLPLQSKHGVTQLLPNIYPCPNSQKSTQSHPDSTPSSMAIGIEQRAGLSFVLTHFRRCLGNRQTEEPKEKHVWGSPKWVGLWALDDGWWTGAAHSRVASALTARVWDTAPARGKTKAADCRSSATKLRRQMLTSVNPRKVEGRKTIKL